MHRRRQRSQDPSPDVEHTPLAHEEPTPDSAAHGDDASDSEADKNAAGEKAALAGSV